MQFTKLLKEVVCFGLAVSCIASNVVPAKATSKSQTESSAQSIIYPNVQSYVSSGKQVFKKADQMRFYVIDDQATTNNAQLLKDLQLMSSEFVASGVVKKAPIIVFGDQQNVAANDIVISLHAVEELANKEQSYKLTISDQLVLEASDEVGIYYGLITIVQALKANEEGLPYGVILDYPDTKERSLHLDAARKYFTKDWIISLIKDLSWQKYNSLQFHFSENEGFRLESDTLNRIGFQYKDNQYLTKQDMLDIIQVANDYHIEIIPSLDSPGHLGNVLTQLDPSYSCSSLFPNDQRSSQCFNIFTNPEAKQFLTDLMTEFIVFFSEAGCKHFNIGGDEFLARFDNFSTEQYRQVIEYFNEISLIVKDHGMTPRAWNDGLMYGDYTGYQLDPDIEICYWTAGPGMAPIQEFIDNGNRVMNYSDKYMYYVLSSWWQNNACPEGDVIYNEWHTGYFPSTPNGAQLIEKPYSDSVVGSSYAIWCDVANYMTQESIAENIFYRTRATAYKMWNYQQEQPTYQAVSSAMDKVGRVPGYKSALPEPGMVYRNQESVVLTVRYVDADTKEDIASPITYYGIMGEQTPYQIEAKALYGYEYVDATGALEGSFDQSTTITLSYRLHTDKQDLESLVANPLQETDYIPATFKDYKASLRIAKEVLHNKQATQAEIDAIVTRLRADQDKVILLDYYPLYVETMYPLPNDHYIEGYDVYQNLVTQARTALENGTVTKEMVTTFVQDIQAAKAGLKKSTDTTPNVDTTLNYYTSYQYARMFDGNPSTFCWFASDQKPGYTIDFVFNQPMELTQIYVLEPEGTDVIFGANVLVMDANNNWKKVGEIKKDTLETTISFDKQVVNKVRFELTQTTINWFKVSEVRFTGQPVEVKHELREAIQNAYTENLSAYTFASASNFIDALLEAQKADAQGVTQADPWKTNLLEARAALEIELMKQVGYSVSLEGNTCLNRYVRVHDDLLQYEDAVVVLTKENQTEQRVLVKDLVKNPIETQQKTVYRLSTPMVAREMNDVVSMYLEYTDDAGQKQRLTFQDVSVVGYAQSILQNEKMYSEEVVAAVKAMLNYGASSQRYFNYKVNELANASLSVEDQDVAKDPSVFDAYAPSKEGSLTGLNYYGSSVSLKDDMMISHYFTLDDGALITDYQATINDSSITLLKSNQFYRIDLENIYAKNLDHPYVLEIHNGQDTMTITYSVLGYAYLVLQDSTSSDSLKDIMYAMYEYNQAANAYANTIK